MYLDCYWNGWGLFHWILGVGEMKNKVIIGICLFVLMFFMINSESYRIQHSEELIVLQRQMKGQMKPVKLTTLQHTHIYHDGSVREDN